MTPDTPDTSRQTAWPAWLPLPGDALLLLAVAGVLLLLLARPSSPPDSYHTVLRRDLRVPLRLDLAALGGEPLTGHYDLTIRLYHAAQGGWPQWFETWPAAEVEQGRVQGMLGSQMRLNPDMVAAYDQLFVGVAVGDGEELPRRVALSEADMAALHNLAARAERLHPTPAVDGTTLMLPWFEQQAHQSCPARVCGEVQPLLLHGWQPVRGRAPDDAVQVRIRTRGGPLLATMQAALALQPASGSGCGIRLLNDDGGQVRLAQLALDLRAAPRATCSGV